MKTKNILVILGGTIYSYLFYQESAGINFVLLNLFLIISAIALNKELLKETAFIAISGGSLLSSLMIMVYSYNLGVTANIISLCLLTHYHLFPKSSIVIAIANFFPSMISSFQNLKQDENDKNGKQWFTLQNFIIGLVCVIITSIFLGIYINSNSIFEAWVGQFNWDFISFGWIFFTLFGFYLIFLFFNHTSLDTLLDIDQKSSDRLMRNRTLSTVTSLYKGLKIEFKTGVLLLSLLNFLLLFVNFSDLQFFIVQELPEGVTLSSLVHQGVYALILSIVFAIGIILFFFRRNLNFYKNNQILKVLTYVWLGQNLILILSIFMKNGIYISEYGLTYKRIGVYVYLILTCVGLVVTFLKVFKIQSNWFLVRKISWSFYTILIISTVFNWDAMITTHNLKMDNCDMTYLLSLSPNAYEGLQEVKNDVNIRLEDNIALILEGKIESYLLEYDEKSWCSWNLTYNNLK